MRYLRFVSPQRAHVPTGRSPLTYICLPSSSPYMSCSFFFLKFLDTIHLLHRVASRHSMSSIPDNNNQDASIDAYNGKVLLAAVICLSIVIFFVLLLHGYARWVLRRRPIVANVVSTEPIHRRSLSTYPGYTTEVALPAGNGLDAKVVASLPKFVYKSKEHENGLHCVVCLSVMVEDEIGRLLPKCKHAFHVECIDMWLMSHSTCPICRAPVKTDEPPASAGDGAPLVVLVEEERSSANEELSVLGGTVEGEVVVEMPIISSDESSNSRSSSSSSSASTSSSVGCSLKRMLSRSRSESRVFPSLPVN